MLIVSHGIFATRDDPIISEQETRSFFTCRSPPTYGTCNRGSSWCLSSALPAPCCRSDFQIRGTCLYRTRRAIFTGREACPCPKKTITRAHLGSGFELRNEKPASLIRVAAATIDNINNLEIILEKVSDPMGSMGATPSYAV